jgi:hypothetical protein
VPLSHDDWLFLMAGLATAVVFILVWAILYFLLVTP